VRGVTWNVEVKNVVNGDVIVKHEIKLYLL